MSKPRRGNIREMVVEMIEYLDKWGLWYEMMILACGNSYGPGDPLYDVEPDVNPDDYIGLVEVDEPRSKHLFDMVFEGPLFEWFSHGYMIFRSEHLEIMHDDAWRYITHHSTVVEDFISRRGSGEFMQDMLSAQSISDIDYSMWDPMEYESLEQYQKEYEDNGEGILVYTLFDSYDDYHDFLYGKAENIRQSPELFELASKYIKKELSSYTDGLKLEGDAARYIREGFDAIFEKYGLWYGLVYNGMITADWIDDEDD